MSEAPVERRSEARRRALLRASVVYGGGRSSMDCIVRDLTSKGAKVKFAGPALVPPIFELRLLDRDEHRHARKIWVRDTEMGIAFE
jgi:hypothetical protein